LNKMDEIILVASRNDVFNNEQLTFQGVEMNQDKVNKIMHSISTSYKTMRRGDAEENPDYKQPIPYCVIRKGNSLYVYERLKGGGESRLHNRLSLGAGGHMNETTHSTFEETLQDNLLRELEEELDIQAEEREFSTIGLINDDENDVGKVHIGMLVALDVDNEATVEVRETEQLKGSWMLLNELMQPDTYERLEPWSKFVVDTLK
jgi:predicted NUDIX family phosphoesterase